MKLYRVLFESEVMILAEGEDEAILEAHRYAREEVDHLIDCQVVEKLSQLGEWKGAIPYSARDRYNLNEKTCEQFVADD
jgi:hypothetical protein